MTATSIDRRTFLAVLGATTLGGCSAPPPPVTSPSLTTTPKGLVPVDALGGALKGHWSPNQLDDLNRAYDFEGFLKEPGILAVTFSLFHPDEKGVDIVSRSGPGANSQRFRSTETIRHDRLLDSPFADGRTGTLMVVGFPNHREPVVSMFDLRRPLDEQKLNGLVTPPGRYLIHNYDRPSDQYLDTFSKSVTLVSGKGESAIVKFTAGNNQLVRVYFAPEDRTQDPTFEELFPPIYR